eukprot:TCALIF_11896-PA protein Name:"Similar to resilin Pro-resilin (Drosophila melanogaster)" AED:0.18 eAED:0.45 QI:0/0/0/1/1/1/2/0/132
MSLTFAQSLPQEPGYGPEHHEPALYEYGYKVHDDKYGTDFGHSENRDGYVTKGEYHVLLPDGRVQTVTYYVDGKSGYVADLIMLHPITPHLISPHLITPHLLLLHYQCTRLIINLHLTTAFIISVTRRNTLH